MPAINLNQTIFENIAARVCFKPEQVVEQLVNLPVI